MENNLNARHRVAALLEARGELNAKEIADAINLSYARLAAVRAMPEYKLLVQQYARELVDRTLDKSSELLAKFNEEAPQAFATLQVLHEKADRDSVRLGAAKEILDRSTVAPTKREGSLGDGGSGVTIQLGSQKMGMIIGALTDIEDFETIDLLEGRDFSVEDLATPIIAKEVP